MRCLADCNAGNISWKRASVCVNAMLIKMLAMLLPANEDALNKSCDSDYLNLKM
jgi:hypothetical protein